MYYCISTLPVMVAEVPVGPTENSKMKMNPAAKKFSENKGGVLPGFMMESYQVRFAIPTNKLNTVLLYKEGCLVSYQQSYDYALRCIAWDYLRKLRKDIKPIIYFT